MAGAELRDSKYIEETKEKLKEYDTMINEVGEKLSKFWKGLNYDDKAVRAQVEKIPEVVELSKQRDKLISEREDFKKGRKDAYTMRREYEAMQSLLSGSLKVQGDRELSAQAKQLLEQRIKQSRDVKGSMFVEIAKKLEQDKRESEEKQRVQEAMRLERMNNELEVVLGEADSALSRLTSGKSSSPSDDSRQETSSLPSGLRRVPKRTI
jgi:hypothetical protein